MNAYWHPEEGLNSTAKNQDSSDSPYVDLFDNIYSIVLEKESYLFSQEELDYLRALRALSYAARYLLIRLSLRKRGKWHTLPSLERSYGGVIGDEEVISSLVDQLCGRLDVPKRPEHGDMFVDLTIGEDPPDTFVGHKFLDDESTADLSELLHCLPLASLKKMGKEMKIVFSMKSRNALIRKIASYCNCQTTLTTYFHKPQLQTEDKRSIPKENQSLSHFRRQILKETGRCIRLQAELFEILDRLNIIFFRSTTHDSSLFLPALLNVFKKRLHASPDYVRTTDIFPSRQIFLDYHKALVLEAQLLDIPEEDSDKMTSRMDTSTVPLNIRKAQHAKTILQIAYSWWKTLLSEDTKEAKNHLFDRFRCEHVLTRIIDNSSASLGTLREYDCFIQILESLLGQQRWRVACRGAWYNRLALIYMVHMGNDLAMLRKALEVVQNGLADKETRSIYRPQLERRLMRLKTKLRITVDKGVIQLNSAKEVYINGCRIHNNSPVASHGTGRTQWEGKEGIISVEEYALEHYGDIGYKGHHTEGRILSTIYGLLFWDIIFSPVPGAFETPYQTAPLDIMDASFYSTRRDVIELRISDIRNGTAKDLVSDVYEKEANNCPTCIGVYWTLKKDDILEIVECMNADALAVICLLISEDYRSMSGGIPDLVIWNTHTRDCKFVEVKSENDQLQENQKVWIDMLLRAGFSVELCNVTDKYSKKRKRS